MKKKEFIYVQNPSMEHPLKEVPIHRKSKLGQYLCHHQFMYLLQEQKGEVFETLVGHKIVHICPLCGKICEKPKLWEEDGMEYK